MMIPLAKPYITNKEIEYVNNCLKTGYISSIGSYVYKFENEFAKYCKCKYGVAVSNCTVALHLALVALDIKNGDEVLIPDLTFAATANAVLYTGAKPILVDSDPNYWCIDPNKIEDKITQKTKAIIPVHIYGHPCNMDIIKEISESQSLYIIEDAAEAHGAEYKGKKVGSLSDISCFSFYGNKIITTGEGGMCLTNDENLVEKMRILRDHGMKPQKKYWHDVIGFNYRMTNLQAALGVAQLEKIDEFINIKRKDVKTYNSLLENINGITLPPEENWAKNVFWMYSILINDEFHMTRDELINHLLKNNIETRPFFNPLHIMPPYKSEEKFPISTDLSRKGVNLPSFVGLREEDIIHIVKFII